LTTNDEFERVWNKAQNSQDSSSWDSYSNPGPLNYEMEVPAYIT